MYHYVLGLLTHLSRSDGHCCWEQGLLGKVQMCGIAFWIVLGGLFRRLWHLRTGEKPLRPEQKDLLGWSQCFISGV